MQYSYPHTIDNGAGEQLTFLQRVAGGNGDSLEAENLVQPGAGPPMHVHFKQVESLTVIKGRIGIQRLGQEPEYLGEGSTVTFVEGDPHRFWNAGNEPMLCRGWVKPAHNIEFFLSEIYKSAKENGGKPGQFDAAWLLTRYRSEYDMLVIPSFVKKIIFPFIVFMGKLAGKHKKFKDAPAPVK